HGVLLRLAQRVERPRRLRARRQSGGEIGWYGGVPLRRVGGGPPPVGFGGLDLGQAGRSHAPGRDQLLDLGHTYLRPPDSRPAGRVPLQVVALAAGLALPGAPAVAQAAVDRLVVGQRRDARALLRDLQPHPGAHIDVPVQPGLELRDVAEGDDRGLDDATLGRHACLLRYSALVQDVEVTAKSSVYQRVAADRSSGQRFMVLIPRSVTAPFGEDDTHAWSAASGRRALRRIVCSMGYATGSVTSEDGTTVGYRRLGRGPGLVLVHGGMQAAHSFMKLATALSDAFTVYVP